FQGADAITASWRMIRADDAAEILAPQQAPMPADAPLSIALALPAQMRLGTYVMEWKLAAGDKVAVGVLPVDVRGYKARFLEFLTDRREYLRSDTVAISGAIESSHALPCRLDLRCAPLSGALVGSASLDLTLPVGRSAFAMQLPLNTQVAGPHVVQYTLTAL